ncbi:DNA-binding transcription factor yap1 [Podila epicladia]|nr:DNA-binding transcription factor yap1 [Podila epicladia]
MNQMHSSDDDEDMLSHEDMDTYQYQDDNNTYHATATKTSSLQPNTSSTPSSVIDGQTSSTSTDKVRKRPGRKPNPTSPTVRKEQNRAAQRAFRDRKERHLQQLENMIKDLKDQHFLVTSGYQREARTLKATIETLQSENYYLREVVFAFEIALSKAGQLVILNDVKEELFRRHYEKHTVSDITTSTGDSLSPRALSDLEHRDGQDRKPARETLQRMLNSSGPFSPAHSATSSSRQTTPAGPTTPQMVPESPATVKSEPHMSPSPAPSASPAPRQQSMDSEPIHTPHPLSISLRNDSFVDPNSVPSMTNNNSNNREILYKAPPLFISLGTDDPVTRSPFESLSAPMPAYTQPGTVLGKKTDSLFGEQSQGGSPVEESPFESGPRKAITSSTSTGQPFTYSRIISPEILAKYPKGFLGPHRLERELQMLAMVPPVMDPDIDSKIYDLPHDPRIDIVPCPKMRAQMILHQSKYDTEELFQLIIRTSVCHGSPFNPSDWQMAPEFFDRYGFLAGKELERLRNKTWPKKKVP